VHGGLEQDGSLLLTEPEDFHLTVVQSHSPDFQEGGFLSLEYMGRRPTLRLFPFGSSNVFGATLDGIFRQETWNERLGERQRPRTDSRGRVIDLIVSAESLRVSKVVSDWRSKAQLQVHLTARGLERVAVYEDMMREGSL